MTEVDELLSKYSLTRDNTEAYIDSIVRMNQTQTAQEVDVSRDTINRYKKAFNKMSPIERSLIIATVTQEKYLEEAQDK